MRKFVLGHSLLVAGLLCGAAGLQACERAGGAPPAPLAALPPTMGAGSSLIPAPTVDQLPPAPPPRLLQTSYAGDGYAFADRAYSMDEAFADSPPDYDFDGDGASPWVWVADDGSERVAEYTSGGGWRYYYYDPGVDQPFFIEDADYGYGFEGGGLVVVYDQYGREAPSAFAAGRDEIAGRYLARATLLRVGAGQFPHQPIAAADWASNRDAIGARRQSWTQAAASVPAWQAYRAQHQAADDAHWNSEQVRRQAWAARVDISLGDPGRAQAEWRAAQSRDVAAGSNGPSNWSAAPPPITPRGPATPAPAQLAHNDAPTQADRTAHAGHDQAVTPFVAPHGPSASSPGPLADVRGAAHPRMTTVQTEPPRTAHAVPADTFATPAAARAPETRRAPHAPPADLSTRAPRPPAAAAFQAAPTPHSPPDAVHAAHVQHTPPGQPADDPHHRD